MELGWTKSHGWPLIRRGTTGHNPTQRKRVLDAAQAGQPGAETATMKGVYTVPTFAAERTRRRFRPRPHIAAGQCRSCRRRRRDICLIHFIFIFLIAVSAYQDPFKLAISGGETQYIPTLELLFRSLKWNEWERSLSLSTERIYNWKMSFHFHITHSPD